MSRRHADNWSHLSHYLVDPYTWPWSPNGHDHGHEWPTATSFVQCQLALPFWDTAISKFDHENPWSRSCMWSKVKVTFDLQNSKVKVMVKFKPIGHIWGLEFNRYICFMFRGNRSLLAEIQEIPYLTLKIQGQGHGQGQTRWSYLSPEVQSICLLLVSWQSDHFWLRYSKFYIWSWKFKVKVMAKVKPYDHIWALEFNRYVCFSFRGNRTIFGWDIANSIFDLENSRSRSPRKSTKIYSGNLQVRANNCAKNERNPKSCSKVIPWTRICGRGWRRRLRRRRTNRYKNIKSSPVYWGDLIK